MKRKWLSEVDNAKEPLQGQQLLISISLFGVNEGQTHETAHQSKFKFSPSEAVDRGRSMSVTDDTMSKAAKYDKLMAELKAKLECPVCLAVPTEGQMLACPRGHLVCASCRVKMTAGGQEDCPVCREPMGNNKSLLAMVVIENMEHECTNTGCKEKLAYKEVTKHKEELCRFRKVLCPGNPVWATSLGNPDELMPLSSLGEHVKTCSEINDKTAKLSTSTEITLEREMFEEADGTIYWNTVMFRVKNETFALRMGFRDNILHFDSVMLAEREKCNRFMTTISVLHRKSGTSFMGQFTPTPIGPEDTEEFALMVHKRSIAKVFTTEEENPRLRIDFKVSEKRPNETID